jgi:hypothetical protein
VSRPYYSQRHEQNPDKQKFDLQLLRELLSAVYSNLNDACYFQEALGMWCVDEQDIPGTLGADRRVAVFIALQKPDLWPIGERYGDYTESDAFDIIEFLYDQISKPIDGTYHSWNHCGWHYTVFDKAAGQSEWRIKINPVLERYAEGYTLTQAGEVEQLADRGLEPLVDAELPTPHREDVAARVDAATRKFRRQRASLDDRRGAVRDLADVLEYLRPKVKSVLVRKDESELFELANSFGIRHHNEKQKTQYDQAVWLSWMFYYYLATIHACVRLIAHANRDQNGQ